MGLTGLDQLTCDEILDLVDSIAIWTSMVKGFWILVVVVVVVVSAGDSKIAQN